MKNKPLPYYKHSQMRVLQCSLFLALLLQVTSLSADNGILNKKLTISLQKTTLKTALSLIEEQASVSFIFRPEQVNVNRQISLKAENTELQVILSQILAPLHLGFEVVGKTIILHSVPASVELKVSGTVTASDSGEPLPGVNVLVKGTPNGTITDVDGNFSITVADQNAILVFSFVGYLTQEVPVQNRSTITVVLPTDATKLSEVVVTALGIKREEKSLGYSAQNVGESAIKDARTNNWVSSLAGKVAGLNLVSTGSGPIGSSRITLRGENSLNLQNNEALIIVDGIPVNNRITGTGQKAHLGADSPVDFGTTVTDINPDDIENVTVLKGPAATALYGSRAANGALIITTKSGSRREKGLGVTFNSNVSFDRVLRWPDYQFEYGEGRTDDYYSYGASEDGPNTSTNVSAGRAWGPKFDGQMYFQYNPNAADGRPVERTEWRPYNDYISGYFNTGVTYSNGISFDGRTDKSSVRLSLTHLKNKYILPNTGFERINAALSLNHEISDKMKISSKVNYSNKWSDNLPLAGYNNHTIMYFLIIGTAPNIRPEWFRNYWQPGLEDVRQRNPFNPGPDNPYLQLYEMLNKVNRHGMVGNFSLSYQFNEKLDVTARAGIDLANEERSQQRPFSMTKYPRGMFRQQDVFQYEINTDVLFTWKDKIGENVNYSFSAGANSMRQHYNFAGMNADQLAMPGVYMISNSLDQAVADPNRWRKAINSVYGTGLFDYKNMIFLQVTGRNDWSSALPTANNSFFYPSVSTSFVLDEIMPLPKAISFSKLRLSWAQVGNDTQPYQIDRYYDKIYSNNFTNPSILFNANLKPEITSNVEAGIDVRLLQNRIGADVTWFKSNSRNQIVRLPLDYASGYSLAIENAGLIESQGVEVMITGKPVVRNNFKWNTTITWARNRSYVKELAEGLSSQVLASHENNVFIEARVGGRMGDMYGLGFQRSPEGKVIYTPDGVPAELDPTLKKWGNAFADWKGGIQNEFIYKGVRLSVLFDGQYGGDVYSQTNHKLNTLGKTRVTLPGRDGGLVGDGVVRQGDGTFVPNTTVVTAMKYYDEVYKIRNAEMNIFDASFVKLREVRLEYSLPSSLISRIGLQQLNVALYGRDLLLFTKFPAFDPEVAMLNSGTIVPGVEMTQFPSTRTMGVNVTAKF